MGKRTKRQIKEDKKRHIEDNKICVMCNFLEKRYKNKITYTCINCLQEAYKSELDDTQGYVTDEELIKSSNNKLKHK
jgi:hypothetical protein